MDSALIAVLLLLLRLLSSTGARYESPPVIGQDNIAKLSPAALIEFSDLTAAGEIANGWFALSHDGQRILIVNRESGLRLIDHQGEILADYSVEGGDGLPATFINGGFDQEAYGVWSIHSDGQQYFLVRLNAGADAPEIRSFESVLAAAWRSSDGRWWLDHGDSISLLDDHSLAVSGPILDRESVIRIGRIEPPLAVTVTEDGRVKRWNMETGAVSAEVQIDASEGLPIYGALNAGGSSHLVWRDPQSDALHLLNFAQRQDRIIVLLDGTYIPFIYLSHEADVIIGVNLDNAPVVAAWDAVSGTRFDLGEYRLCNRPPDMVRLSTDGTTLVIGCDLGLEVWQIVE